MHIEYGALIAAAAQLTAVRTKDPLYLAHDAKYLMHKKNYWNHTTKSIWMKIQTNANVIAKSGEHQEIKRRTDKR